MPALPIISGHSPGHLRDGFESAVDTRDEEELHHLSGLLWNCSDVMPVSTCDELDMQAGSTYAQAARRLRRGLYSWRACWH